MAAKTIRRQKRAVPSPASNGSTSLVFSSLARKVKFALERGELGVCDPEAAWSKAYFLNRAETDQLRRWLNREAKSNEKLSALKWKGGWWPCEKSKR